MLPMLIAALEKIAIFRAYFSMYRLHGMKFLSIHRYLKQLQSKFVFRNSSESFYIVATQISFCCSRGEWNNSD